MTQQNDTLATIKTLRAENERQAAELRFLRAALEDITELLYTRSCTCGFDVDRILARAMTLEEAARVAESFTTPPIASDFGTVIVDQGGEIAAAIRSLMKETPNA